ncbi:MAG TPA: FAD binding domain-containing protein [Verrucomicrobiae bacterium]|nr:FAD binding domain-containing protein [Verrucomicrobiae bacterium]
MNFYQPTTIEEALALAGPNTRFLAGGTDLVLQMREGKIMPKTLIDLGRIQQLQQVIRNGAWLEIGSMVTFSNLSDHELVRSHAHALWQACRTMGSPQVRNQATIGGNLGNNSPAADGLPPLLVLDARVKVAVPQGEKLLPIAEVIKTPLPYDHLIVGFCIPLNQWQSGFAKLGRRNALAIARLSVALAVQSEGNRVKDIRVALGAVGRQAFLADDLAKSLVNQSVDETWIELAVAEAKKVVGQALGERPSAAYKRVAAGGVMRKAIQSLALQKGG